jgi:hypothetical protein
MVIKWKYLCLFVLIVLFLSGCDNPEVTQFKVYNPASQFYYAGTFNFDRSYLEEDTFQFAFFSDKNLLDVQEVKFYYQNQEVVFDKTTIRSLHEENKVYGSEDVPFYSYLLEVDLSKEYFTQILIDKITLKLNDKYVSFSVNIGILYDERENFAIKPDGYNFMYARPQFTDEFTTVDYFFQWGSADITLNQFIYYAGLNIETVEVGYQDWDDKIHLSDYTVGMTMPAFNHVIRVKYQNPTYTVLFNESIYLDLTVNNTENYIVPLTQYPLCSFIVRELANSEALLLDPEDFYE